MTVRFKSEYQRSFGASGSSRATPRQRPPLASLQPETPAGPRPPAEPEPAGGAAGGASAGGAAGGAEEPGAAAEGGAGEGGAAKPRPSRPSSQSQPSRPVTAAAGGEVDAALRRRAGLRPRGQRSGRPCSEYRRQFGWKMPAANQSPILTAQQVWYSSSRSVPPFKKNPVAPVTEYQRSFLGLAPPTGPRLRKHLEQQRAPLFHAQLRSHKRRREEPQRKPRPQRDAPQAEGEGSPVKATPPSSPPQVHRGHRTSTEHRSSFQCPFCRNPEGGGATEGHAQQVEALRQQAQAHRRRAWGTNFSREHLSQLLSEHNALWEPADSTEPPSPRPDLPPSPRPHRRSSSRVEALDLSSEASSRSPRVRSAGPPAERRTAWDGGAGGAGAGGEEGTSSADEEEGRLPTPRLKTMPVQRTHHDLTTPATGGAILVGKLRSVDDWKCGSVVSVAAGAEPLVDVPVKQKGVWPEKGPAPSSSVSSPKHKPASSPPSKPIRTKQTPPPAEAPPPLHGIHGTLRHAEFQHNGELGLRLREPPCSGGGCGSDQDDRLSVMSWRSAASCSAASEVLERALKRRDDFWAKT